MNGKEGRQPRKYLIALAEKHSILALAAGLMLFVITFTVLVAWLGRYDSTGEYPLHYFTVLSNIMSAIAATFMIPYAVEGIRKKHFVLPRFVVLFQFSAVVCVSITMLAAMTIILPTQGAAAVQGVNFWLHIVTPLCAVLLFHCVETGTSISRREALVCLIPFWTYMVVYFTMVILVGEENGGWSDFYMTRAFWPVWVSMILFIVIGFAMAALMRAIHNRLAVRFWKRVSRLWTDDTMPEEMLVEAFGLGRYVGHNLNSGVEISVPISLFGYMAQRFSLPVEKLINAYIYGALDSIREKEAADKN